VVLMLKHLIRVRGMTYEDASSLVARVQSVAMSKNMRPSLTVEVGDGHCGARALARQILGETQLCISSPSNVLHLSYAQYFSG